MAATSLKHLFLSALLWSQRADIARLKKCAIDGLRLTIMRKMTGKDGRHSPSEIWHAKTEHDATEVDKVWLKIFGEKLVAYGDCYHFKYKDIQTDQTAKGFSRQESLMEDEPTAGCYGRLTKNAVHTSTVKYSLRKADEAKNLPRARLVSRKEHISGSVFVTDQS